MHAQGLRLWGAGGAKVVIFSKHGHMADQIDVGDKQNRMQVYFYPRVKLVTLG